MKNKKIYFARMRHRFNFEIWWIGCSLMTFLCFYCSSAIFQLHKDGGVLLTLSILLLGLIFASVGIIATVCYPICGVYIENEKSELFAEVMSLPQKYSIVLHLYYYEDYSVREISRILGISETNVQTRLMRARKKLRVQLKEAWNDEQI